MRKNIVLIVCLTTCCVSLSAQKGMRFSIFANPCVNWFESDIKKAKSGSAMAGFDAGLTLDNYFAENYAFTTGISIGSSGGNILYTDSTTFNTHGQSVTTLPGTVVKYKLQYITIPLGLKFKTKEIGYLTYFAHLGITTQLNIKARASSNDIVPTLDEDNVGAEINAFNMGYHIGAGAQYAIGGNTALVFGITYTNGFLDITKNSDDNITSSGIALRIGLLF